MRFAGYNNDAENFVQGDPEAGVLKIAFEDPKVTGDKAYEVMPISLGDPIVPTNWEV